MKEQIQTSKIKRLINDIESDTDFLCEISSLSLEEEYKERIEKIIDKIDEWYKKGW